MCKDRRTNLPIHLTHQMEVGELRAGAESYKRTSALWMRTIQMNTHKGTDMTMRVAVALRGESWTSSVGEGRLEAAKTDEALKIVC